MGPFDPASLDGFRTAWAASGYQSSRWRMCLAELHNVAAPRLRVRRGMSRVSLLGLLAVVLVIACGGLWSWGAFSDAPLLGELITHRAVKGLFVHDVVERGELESSSNVEIRCEVRARAATGTKI